MTACAAVLTRSAVAVTLTMALGLVAAGARPARAQRPGAEPWAGAREVAPGPPEAIGGYSAGCIRGAAALPLRGKGFRLMRPERGRRFGHPELIAFLRELGQKVHRRHLGTLHVGDLAQPRGGPAPTGHASHQTGLDVDVWYVLDGKGGRTEPRSVVAPDGTRLSAAWNRRIARVLELAAKDARVDRIFVHPVVKRELCERSRGDRGWLRKIRPWFGHDDHFHVRLACPPGSPLCESQAPVSDGDGCAELDWWFRQDAAKERDRRRQSYQDRVGAALPLPERCLELVGGVAAR